jgi:hypothetical protein
MFITTGRREKALMFDIRPGGVRETLERLEWRQYCAYIPMHRRESIAAYSGYYFHRMP